MEIFQGIKSPDEIEPLMDEGVKEFYTGLIDGKDFSLTNHYEPEWGLTSLEGLAEAVNIAHKRNGKLFIAINDTFYSAYDADRIIAKLDELPEMGVDGIITPSLAMFIELQERSYPIEVCLSTLQPVFNSEAVDFFKQFNLSRIVFPEQIGAYEVESVLKQPNIKTEAFLWITHDCANVEYYCIFHHQAEKHITIEDEEGFKYCRHIPTFSPINNKTNQDAIKLANRDYRSEKRYKINGFGNLYDFNELGLDLLKMGNRPLPLPVKILCVQIANAMIEKLNKKELSRDDFIDWGKNLLAESRGKVDDPKLRSEANFWELHR